MEPEKTKNGNYRIRLEHPIPGKTPEDGMINRIRIEEFKAKHLKYLPKKINEEQGLAAEEFLPLIAGLSGLPLSSIEELHLSDLFKIVDVVGSFLEDSHLTGEKQSG